MPADQVHRCAFPCVLSCCHECDLHVLAHQLMVVWLVFFITPLFLGHGSSVSSCWLFKNPCIYHRVDSEQVINKQVDWSGFLHGQYEVTVGLLC